MISFGVLVIDSRVMNEVSPHCGATSLLDQYFCLFQRAEHFFVELRNITRC